MSKNPQPRPNVTKATCLQRWDTTTSHLNPISAQCPPGLTPRFLECPFPVNHQINSKVCIWEGDITMLEVDAVIAGTNEYEPPRRSFSERVFQRSRPRAEPEPVPEVGSVKITEEPWIVANYLLYTVAPKYRPRNRSVCDSELHFAYRNVLEKARQRGFTSLGLGILHSTKKNYPPIYGAHICLRTLRRYLEHYPDAFDVVVLVVDSFNHGLYDRVLALYFPRTPLEEEAACWKLPLSIGGSWGEPISGQEMRIIENPQATSEEEAEGDLYALRHQVGEHPFAKMESDLDTERLLGGRQTTFTTGDPILDIIMKDFEKKGRYERMLRQARNVDLSEIARLGCIYQSGTDRLGRPVVVLVGRWFRAKETNHNKFFLYLISLMDGIVNNEYVIIYFHTKTTNENRPGMNWFTAMYNLLPYKYKKNLKAVYVVHPSFWTKSLTWWFAKFLAPNIRTKIHSVSGIEYLYNVMLPDELEIPAFITEYDMSINGVHYYKPKRIESEHTDLEAIAALSRLGPSASEPVPSTSGLGSSSREPLPSTSGVGSSQEPGPSTSGPSSSSVDTLSPKAEVETSTWELRQSKSGFRFTKLEPRTTKLPSKASTTSQVSQSGLPYEHEKQEPLLGLPTSFAGLSISESQPRRSTSQAGLPMPKSQLGLSTSQAGLPMPKSQLGLSTSQAGLPMPKSQLGLSTAQFSLSTAESKKKGSRPSTSQAGLPMPKSQAEPSTSQAGLPMPKSQLGLSTAQFSLSTAESKKKGSRPSTPQVGLPMPKSQAGPSTSQVGLPMPQSQAGPSTSQVGLPMPQSQAGPSTSQVGLPMPKSQAGPSTSQVGLPMPQSQAGPSTSQVGLPMPQSQAGPSTSQVGLPMPKSQAGPSTSQVGLPMPQSQAGPSTSQVGLPMPKSQAGPSTSQVGLPMPKSQAGPSTSQADLSTAESKRKVSKPLPIPARSDPELDPWKVLLSPSSSVGSSPIFQSHRPPDRKKSEVKIDPWLLLQSPATSEPELAAIDPEAMPSSSGEAKSSSKPSTTKSSTSTKKKGRKKRSPDSEVASTFV